MRSQIDPELSIGERSKSRMSIVPGKRSIKRTDSDNFNSIVGVVYKGLLSCVKKAIPLSRHDLRGSRRVNKR